MGEQPAIIVKNARKQYKKGPKVLDGLNLSVFKGSIYSLLGSSGCGKTTLLSCIVGVRQLDSGDIWVLGGHPGTKGSGIPGSRVGYVPQDISLTGEFSVIGALYYFGRINGMEDEMIEERYTVLKDLLQLPPRSSYIKNISGGQQRRVSLAAALIHKPELLILDEPTVGLDPILRDNIWNHLIKLAEGGVTIIITTHYIEEAKQANRVGLMRCGKLLAESTPTQLLEHFQTDSLEDAFLALSQMQAQNQEINIPELATPQAQFNNLNTLSYNAGGNYGTRPYRYSNEGLTYKKYKALLSKNIAQITRHPGGYFFTLLIPLIEVTIFFNSIGLDPKGLSISIVNDEAGDCNYGNTWGNVTYNPDDFSCQFSNLSCRFLNGFDDSLAKKLYYTNFGDAKDNIANEKSVGIIYFGKNFSKALELYLDDRTSLSEQDIELSQVQISLDMGDRQTGIYMQKKLYDSLYNVMDSILEECKVPPKYLKLPVNYEDPIHGSMDDTLQTVVAPLFVLTLVFFLPITVSTSVIISDRLAGVWDRSLVQGVTTVEIFNTHLITNLLIVILQVALTLCLAFGCFDLDCDGSFFTLTWLTILQGISGMAYGFVLSVISTSYTLADFMSTGTFYTMVFLSGMLWPLKGMPDALRYISYVSPVTLPGVAMRGLMYKGQSFDEPDVYNGFLVIIAWIMGSIGLCILNLKYKRV